MPIRKMVLKEGIVRRYDEAEVATPGLDAFLDGAETPDGGKTFRVRLTTEARDNMKKRALVSVDQPGFGPFAMWCDEGTSLGGEDSAPAPLAYFAAAFAF